MSIYSSAHYLLHFRDLPATPHRDIGPNMWHAKVREHLNSNAGRIKGTFSFRKFYLV